MQNIMRSQQRNTNHSKSFSKSFIKRNYPRGQEIVEKINRDEQIEALTLQLDNLVKQQYQEVNTSRSKKEQITTRRHNSLDDCKKKHTIKKNNATHSATLPDWKKKSSMKYSTSTKKHNKTIK